MSSHFNNPLIIYHADCNDGFGAAYAAWRHFGDAAEYLPMKYGQPAPEVTGRSVYVLDFSFPPEVMQEIHDDASLLVWLDHHKTAFEAAASIEFIPKEATALELGYANSLLRVKSDRAHVLLDNYKSGCILAWEHFFPAEPVPLLLQHIDDRDRWQFKLYGTKEMHAFLSSVNRTFDSWDAIASAGHFLDNMRAHGASILAAQERTLQSMLAATTRHVTLTGIDGLCANLPPCFASEGGHLLATESGTFGLTWYVTTDAKVSCSLRSNGDFDVSAIAKQFGGGGHKNAAGFTLPGDQVVWFGAGFLESDQPVEM